MSEEKLDATIEKETGRKETGRIEAFSDGVFAVAITLFKGTTDSSRRHKCSQGFRQYLVESMALVSCFCYQFCNNLDHVGKSS
jgi:uncharacterized membrane protein